jgi:hypothetical protein
VMIPGHMGLNRRAWLTKKDISGWLILYLHAYVACILSLKGAGAYEFL